MPAMGMPRIVPPIPPLPPSPSMPPMPVEPGPFGPRMWPIGPYWASAMPRMPSGTAAALATPAISATVLRRISLPLVVLSPLGGVRVTAVALARREAGNDSDSEDQAHEEQKLEPRRCLRHEGLPCLR